MLRSFEGLALLREIKELMGDAFEKSLRNRFKKQIVIINRVAFIPRECLPKDIQKQVTDLDNFFLMAYLSRELGINKETFRSRIAIMESQGVTFFKYKKICNLYFIKVTDEQKNMLEKYEAVRVNMKYMHKKRDEIWMSGLILIGDISVVLY